MATSLVAQLQRLAVPDTEQRKRPFTRPSILFDPKEAADIELDTILNIAQSGANPFQAFTDSCLLLVIFSRVQGIVMVCTFFAWSSCIVFFNCSKILPFKCHETYAWLLSCALQFFLGWSETRKTIDSS